MADEFERPQLKPVKPVHQGSGNPIIGGDIKDIPSPKPRVFVKKKDVNEKAVITDFNI